MQYSSKWNLSKTPLSSWVLPADFVDYVYECNACAVLVFWQETLMTSEMYAGYLQAGVSLPWSPSPARNKGTRAVETKSWKEVKGVLAQGLLIWYFLASAEHIVLETIPVVTDLVAVLALDVVLETPAEVSFLLMQRRDLKVQWSYRSEHHDRPSLGDSNFKFLTKDQSCLNCLVSQSLCQRSVAQARYGCWKGC